MKKIAIILGVLLVSLGAVAQEKSNVKQSDLKGPAFKNYQHWMHKTEPTIVYSEVNKESIQGPAYKNSQPWRDNSNKELAVVSTDGSEQQKLTGPAYKNHGPWIDSPKKDLEVASNGSEKQKLTGSAYKNQANLNK